LLHCPGVPGEECVREPFKYFTSLATHMQVHHKLSKEDAHATARGVQATEMRREVLGDDDTAAVVLLYDLETTGLMYTTQKKEKVWPRIVQIAVKVIKTGETFDSYVDPQISIPPAATTIHGITNEIAKLAPTFDCVIHQLFDMLSNVVCPQDKIVLMAHNGKKFDEPILREEFQRWEIPVPTNWFFADSIPLFKSILQKSGSKSFSLAALYDRLFSAPIPKAHSACGDIDALERCLRKVLPGACGDIESRVISAILSSIA